MHRLVPVIRLLAFLVTSLVFLVVGCFGAQLVWRRLHHRYDHPQTGAYQGWVRGNFSSSESTFSFSFEGQTATRWYWTYPTNFAYRRLALEWHNFVDDSEGKAILNLPDFHYESAHSTGVLSPEILAGWLLGRTGQTPTSSESARVEQLFGYLRAAAEGTLPPPNHHGYSFGYESEEPLIGRIQHFRLGTGIGSTVYFWIVVWGVATLLCGRALLKRRQESNNQMHRTATSRCGFEDVGMIGYWIRSRSPLPVAGDLSCWAMRHT